MNDFYYKRGERQKVSFFQEHHGAETLFRRGRAEYQVTSQHFAQIDTLPKINLHLKAQKHYTLRLTVEQVLVAFSGTCILFLNCRLPPRRLNPQPITDKATKVPIRRLRAYHSSSLV